LNGSAPAKVRVLAIDPGTVVAGFGVLEASGEDASLLECGCIRPPSRAEASVKLLRIFREVTRLLRTHRPDILALEDVFYHKNVRSTLKLGEVRGICSLAAARAGIRVISYSPRAVKKAVVGNGAADKTQVQRMVAVLLGLTSLPEPLDVSDALALGLACLQDIRFRALVEKS